MTDEELKKAKAERPALTREEAAEFIKQHCCPYYPDKVDGTRWEAVMHMAIETLREHDRKVGKWIIDGNKCICSSCGSDDTYNLLAYRYCPWCGNPMEVDE